MWQRIRSASGGPAARLSILFGFSVNIESLVDLASRIRKTGNSTYSKKTSWKLSWIRDHSSLLCYGLSNQLTLDQYKCLCSWCNRPFQRNWTWLDSRRMGRGYRYSLREFFHCRSLFCACLYPPAWKGSRLIFSSPIERVWVFLTMFSLNRASLHLRANSFRDQTKLPWLAWCLSELSFPAALLILVTGWTCYLNW